MNEEIKDKCFKDFCRYIKWCRMDDSSFTYIKPMDHYMIEKLKSGQEMMVLATIRSGLSKESTKKLTRSLSENITYGGSNVEFKICYLPGDLFICFDIPKVITESSNRYGFIRDDNMDTFESMMESYFIEKRLSENFHMRSLNEMKPIITKIYHKVKSDAKKPVGNQNCQLCTWCTEAQFRGRNILPRPIYSPRDNVLEMNGYDIVKDPVKEKISNKEDLIDKIKEPGFNSRYYIHVNWKGKTSGHEFMIVNDIDNLYVIDSQAGLLEEISSPKVSKYFDDVNYKNSYIVRLDDKEFNDRILQYNESSYIVEWDNVIDPEYLKSLE